MTRPSNPEHDAARYRALFEGAHDGVLVLDGYVFTECNPRAEELFGMPADEIIGATPWQLSPDMQLDGTSSEASARRVIDRAVAGEPQQFEWVHLDGDRTPFIVEVSLSRVRVGDEHLVQVIHRDITDRVRARLVERKRLRQLAAVGQVARRVASLHDVESVLRTAVDEVHRGLEYDTVVILRLDAETGVLGRPTIAGRYASRLVGDFTQRLDEGLIGAAASTARPVLVNDVSSDDRFIPAIPEFNVTAAELAVPIVIGERVAGVLDVQETEVGAFDDIDLQTLETVAALVASSLHTAELVEHLQRELAERRRAEEELRHAQKMEALGRLAGGIAHDFNNLLQAVLSTVQLVGRELGEESSDAARSMRELEKHVQRGASLARQLLLFARRGVTRPERVDLDALVEDAVALLDRLLRDNVEVVHRPSPEPAAVSGDRGQLEQILTNLVVNAADAIQGAGRIELRTGVLDDERAYVEVADTGSGIDAEVLPRIFEPFFTTKGHDSGTGLGLSVVHGIVTSHGGRIEVDSAPGSGSTFRVVLPRHDTGGFRPVAASSAPDAESVAGDGERVLLVEDDPGIRTVMCDLLERLGYRVTGVSSGEEAASLPAEPPFELLVTDVMLPGRSGPELAADLARRWPDMAVILMSGYAADDVLRREVVEGRVRFLQKPVRLETLSSEVREALDERRR